MARLRCEFIRLDTARDQGGNGLPGTIKDIFSVETIDVNFTATAGDDRPVAPSMGPRGIGHVRLIADDNMEVVVGDDPEASGGEGFFIVPFEPISVPILTGQKISAVVLNTVGNVVPSAFVAGNWSVADDGTNGDITITVAALPDDGDSPITDIEYRIDGGDWVSGAISSPDDINVDGLEDGTEVTVEIRAVNAVGNSADSDDKTVTPTGVPDAFVAGDWSVADDATSGDITITVASLPDDAGETITVIEYRIDGGAWTTGALAVPGDIMVAGLTDDVEVDVEIRAVNANGDGAASDVKQVTPTAA